MVFYLHESDFMLLSVETRLSHGSMAQSLNCPLCCYIPSSSCDSVYGSNLPNHSHIVPLIKFNDLAATSGVWKEGEEDGGEGHFFQRGTKSQGRGEKESANPHLSPCK